jgi:hypothetical protein
VRVIDLARKQANAHEFVSFNKLECEVQEKTPSFEYPRFRRSQLLFLEPKQ